MNRADVRFRLAAEASAFIRKAYRLAELGACFGTPAGST